VGVGRSAREGGRWWTVGRGGGEEREGKGGGGEDAGGVGRVMGREAWRGRGVWGGVKCKC